MYVANAMFRGSHESFKARRYQKDVTNNVF